MTLAEFLKLVHVFTAFWLVAGIIGRTVAMAKAQNSSDIRAVCAILPVADVFERAMVIPGSMAAVAAGIITAVVAGWPVLGFLQGGQENWLLVSLLLFLTLIPLIRFVFLARGKEFKTALDDAVAKDQVTQRLHAAFRDPVVRAGHLYELAVLGVIICLMVLKPF